MGDKTELLLPVFLAVFITTVLTVEPNRARETTSWNTSHIDAKVFDNPPFAQSDITPEQRILSRMHQINLLEIKAGQIAFERSNSNWVRKYADRLIRDHRSADKKILQIADEEDIELVSSQLDEKLPRQRLQTFEQMMGQLERLGEKEFDQLFLKMMIMFHRQSLDMLRTTLEDLQNENVRELVENVIPILDQHRKLARHVQSDVVT